MLRPNFAIHAVFPTPFAVRGRALSGWFGRMSKDAEPMTIYAKGAGVDGANLAKVLSGRRGPSRAMLAKLQAALAQDR
jgi:hypothetical protein